MQKLTHTRVIKAFGFHTCVIKAFGSLTVIVCILCSISLSFFFLFSPHTQPHQRLCLRQKLGLWWYFKLLKCLHELCHIHAIQPARVT